MGKKKTSRYAVRLQRRKVFLVVGVVVSFLLAASVFVVANSLRKIEYSLSLAQQLNVSMSLQPAQTTLASNEAKTFSLSVNSGSRQVSFARAVVLFDTARLELANEIDVAGSPLTTQVEKTSRANANSSGRAIVVLALSPDGRNNPPSGTVSLANFSFRAKATSSTNVNTQITIDGSDIQVVDLQENALAVSTGNSSITINPSSVPTATSTATAVPTQTATATPRPTTGPTATPVPPSSGLISNLRVANNKNYGIGTANPGVSVYIDRSYTFNDSLPSNLRGVQFIRTANDDKNSKDNPFITFNVNGAVTVYVALDTRVSPPSWMGNFTNTGQTYNLRTVAGQQDTYRLYRRSYSSGQVALGGNINSNASSSSTRSMYTVFVAGGTSGGGGQTPVPTAAPTIRPTSPGFTSQPTVRPTVVPGPVLPPIGNISSSNLSQYCPIYRSYNSLIRSVYSSRYPASAFEYMDKLCGVR